MLTIQDRVSSREDSAELLALKALEELNSWKIRQVSEIVSADVNSITNSMNIYNNVALSPEILETLLVSGFSLEKTHCERHINKNWEYVHVLSLLDMQQEKTWTYVELRCKPHITSEENMVYMKTWNNKLEINKDNIINQQLFSVSPYVYLSDKWNETASWSWTQSI